MTENKAQPTSPTLQGGFQREGMCRRDPGVCTFFRWETPAQAVRRLFQPREVFWSIKSWQCFPRELPLSCSYEVFKTEKGKHTHHSQLPSLTLALGGRMEDTLSDMSYNFQFVGHHIQASGLGEGRRRDSPLIQGVPVNCQSTEGAGGPRALGSLADPAFSNLQILCWWQQRAKPKLYVFIATAVRSGEVVVRRGGQGWKPYLKKLIHEGRGSKVADVCHFIGRLVFSIHVINVSCHLKPKATWFGSPVAYRVFLHFLFFAVNVYLLMIYFKQPSLDLKSPEASISSQKNLSKFV